MLTVEDYGDATCSSKNGEQLYNIDINTCWQPPGSSSSIKGVICDPDNIVAILFYQDNACAMIEKAEAYKPETCTITGASSAQKFVNVALTGNMFGIGYLEGWSIFLCQTILFGVCDG